MQNYYPNYESNNASDISVLSDLETNQTEENVVSAVEKEKLLKDLMIAIAERRFSEVGGKISIYKQVSEDKQQAVVEILNAAMESNVSEALSLCLKNGAACKDLKKEYLQEIFLNAIETKKQDHTKDLFNHLNGYWRTGKISSLLDSEQLGELLIKAYKTENLIMAGMFTQEIRPSRLTKEVLSEAVEIALGYEDKRLLYTLINGLIKENVKLDKNTQDILYNFAVKEDNLPILRYLVRCGDLDKSQISKIVDLAIAKNDLPFLSDLVVTDSLSEEAFNTLFAKVITAGEYDLDDRSQGEYINNHYGLFLMMMEKASFNTYKEVLIKQGNLDKVQNILMTESMCYELKGRKFETSDLKKEVKEIVQKLRDREMQINDIKIEKESPNMVDQVLSLSDNQSFLIEFQELVYKTYEDVVKEGLEKNSDIKENFPVEGFEKSLQRCKDFIRRPGDFKLSEMTTDISDFMVVPLYVPGHCFAGFIRKLDNGDFSMTAVNLGARPFESGSHSYMEFVYDKMENLQSIIDKYGYCDFQGKTNITRCYRDFKAKAKEHFTLKTESRLQKTGNCFTKNPEKAVRYGLSLILEKMKNPEFKQEDIRTKEGFRPTHYKELVRGKIRINEIIVERLSKEFPEKKAEFEKTLEKYKKRKTRRFTEEKENKPELTEQKVAASKLIEKLLIKNNSKGMQLSM